METLAETCRSIAGNNADSIAENKSESTVGTMVAIRAGATVGTTMEINSEMMAEMMDQTLVETAGESSEEVAGFGRGMAPGSKATQFKSRHPGRQARKMERAKETIKPCRLLKDMRWVSAHQAYRDRTPGQKTCRKWLKKDLTGFMSRLVDLEKEFAALLSKERKAGQQR